MTTEMFDLNVNVSIDKTIVYGGTNEIKEGKSWIPTQSLFTHMSVNHRVESGSLVHRFKLPYPVSKER